MTAKVICLASAKGGAGKTGLCATFATFLSGLGKKVLVIDSDFATCGLTLLFVKEVQVTAELSLAKSVVAAGLHEALFNDGMVTFNRVKISEGFDLIPASFNLLMPDWNVTGITSIRFQTIISALREKYDFIFIDSQAGADQMAQISMSRKVSDEVIIVSEYDPMSAAGVERLKATLREDLTYERTWILLNKILPEFAKSFSDFLNVAKYLSPIPWDSEVVRAYARRSLAINSETGTDYTLSIIQTIKGLFEDSIKEELAYWIDSRAAAIRQPIEQQYQDAELEMTSLLHAQNEIEQKKRKRKLVGYGMISAVFSAIAISAWIFTDQWKIKFPMTDSDIGGMISLAGTVVAVVFTMVTAFRVTNSVSDVDSIVESSRLQRQLGLLEEKLKKLELLRTLDAENLLRHRLK
jgi:septum site-determining protein MinD